MIQINRVDRIPNAAWAENSYREFLSTDPKVVERLSQYIWTMDDGELLACGGLIYSNFTTEPWFWLLLTKSFKKSVKRNLLTLMRYVDNLGTVRALVDVNFAEGKRFAWVFGFAPTGQIQGMGGRSFEVFRRG